MIDGAERIWVGPFEYVRADTAEAAIEMWREIAIATEARRAGTAKQGPVHEGAAIAQPQSGTISGGGSE